MEMLWVWVLLNVPSTSFSIMDYCSIKWCGRGVSRGIRGIDAMIRISLRAKWFFAPHSAVSFARCEGVDDVLHPYDSTGSFFQGASTI